MDLEKITSAIESRYGVCPKFFTIAKDSPLVVEYLFRQAEFAYLDAPFPSLFKEQLFTYLSRFCSVPYCMLRHAAFLVGRGNPSGDASSDILSSADVIELLRTPIPSAELFDDHLENLKRTIAPLSQWPAPASALEESVFFAGVCLFIQTGPVAAMQAELRRVLGKKAFDRFGAFLAFIRMAHFWTELHAELSAEADVEEMLAADPMLADWFENYQEDVKSELASSAVATTAQLRMALLSSELQQENLHKIIEKSLNEIYLFDESSLRFVYVNQSARNNLGYTIDELRALTPIDINPEFTLETFEKELEALRSNKKVKIDFTTVHKRKDGSTYPVEVHLQRSEFGSIPVFAAIILDITMRTQTEEALALSRLFLESAPDPSVIVNGEGIIEVANLRMTSLFGYMLDELRGMPIERLIPERYREGHFAHRLAFNANPRGRDMGADLELFALRKDGREVPIEVSLSPIQTGDGMLVAAAIRDITAKKAAAEALKDAKEVAESATQTKSRFLAAASHDLRQPLHSIGLYLSVLNRKLDNPENQAISDKIRDSLDVMGELLDALLDISKLDSGSLIPSRKDFSTETLFNHLVANNEPHAREKGLKFHCNGELCVLHSDQALLQRIVENFVSNAIRYTDSGSVEVHCKRIDDHARIEVRDSGAGIPEDALETIFEEYFQLDNPVRDRRKGLGLGLSIVKHIARLLDHRLEVSSVSGEGSTFAVYVPLGQPIEQALETPAPVKAPKQIGRKPVVLFVDDDPAIVDATTMLLEVSGFEVYSALNGDEALTHVDNGIRPDIVVSDYRLPGYNGIEVVRRIRQATVENLPTVLMTGDTSAQEIEGANLTHCTVLHKPANTDQLVALIETLTA